MIGWSIEAFANTPQVERVVVAVPVGWRPASEAEHAALGDAIVCEGGAERSMSVRNALAATEGPAHEAVLVHDAARPLVTVDLITRMIASVSGPDGHLAAVAAAPVTDTIRMVGTDGVATATPDRSLLRAVQTPQAFTRETLARALSLGEADLAAATDDASLVERLGIEVALIDAPPENIKVTNPNDIKLAQLLLADRERV